MSKPIKIPGLDEEVQPVSDQEIRISVDKRRYGKAMTIIDGFDTKITDVKSLASQLKSLVAAGGTAKDDHIELQGDQRVRVRVELEKLGFRVVE